MDKIEQLLELGNANCAEVAKEFEKLLLGAARHAVCQAMGMEVEKLCGPKYKPAGKGDRRGPNSSFAIRG